MEQQSESSPPVVRPFIRSIIILIRHWRFIIITSACGAIVAGIIAFTIPNSFRAAATFLPPQKQSGLLESVTSGLSTTLKSFGLSKMSNTSAGVYSYLSILNSRAMGERIIQKYDLMKVYKIQNGSEEKALQQLHDNVEFSLEEEGHISVSVEDLDPKRAAEIANTFITELDQINSELNISEAKSNRIFIEQQYNTTINTLKSLEDSFIVFQKRTKLYSLPEQTKAALTGAATIHAQLLYQQVAVAVAEKMYGENDADVVLAKTKLRELENSIEKEQSGQGTIDLIPPMKDMPKEGMEYLRLYRDYEIYSKLLGFLMPMYQQAKIDENKETKAVVVLDQAVAPEKKYRPKRSIIIGISFLSVLTLGIAFVLIRDRLLYYQSNHPDEWKSMHDSFRRTPVS